MPELPEVETIRRDLKEKVKGKKVKRVVVVNDKCIKMPDSREFISGIEGRFFQQINRRGKYLIIGLDSGDNLVIHLKLTGRLIYSLREKKLNYSKIIFVFYDSTQLIFTDMRGFGNVWLLFDKEFQRIPSLNNLGPEPLEKGFTLNKFKKILKGKRSDIKSLLMNQGFIAGIGNVYSQEALFLSEIHPKRKALSLRDEEIDRLYNNLRGILDEAISYRGSSVDAYVDLQGEKGEYEPHLMVYGRKGKKCFQCGTIIQKISIKGRGTYFCPSCQS
ncbi:MAG: DNA-formamidopyrimidine glycosylase [Candidatus Aerophobetes bacterium]|nr:DNA-formamidopyrimidine glycosylase [Candidatus Aerophobetes bacterium]